jgi:hypothetical protein
MLEDVLLPLAAAVVGGSIGVAITLLVGAADQVRNHDALVAEYDHDLGQWTADEAVRLERALIRSKNELANQGQLYSGYRWTAAAHLKEESLYRYREQERSARRHTRLMRDAEGWRHSLVRLVRGTFPALKSPAEVAPILDTWRRDVAGDDRSWPVSDPTTRSVRWAVDKYGPHESYDQFS